MLILINISNIKIETWKIFILISVIVLLIFLFSFLIYQLRIRKIVSLKKQFEKNFRHIEITFNFLNKTSEEFSKIFYGDIDKILKIVFSQIKTLFKVDNISIALYDSFTKTLRFEYVLIKGEPPEQDQLKWSPRHLRNDKNGKTETIILSKEPILIKTRKEHFNWYKEHNNEDLIHKPLASSWLGVPLITQNKVLGVISVFDLKNGDKFDEQDKQLMSILASQAAIAIDNSRMYLNINKREKALVYFGQAIASSVRHTEKEILNHIYQISSNLLSINNLAICLYNNSSQKLRLGLLINEGNEIETNRALNESIINDKKIKSVIKSCRPLLLSTRKEIEEWTDPDIVSSEFRKISSWLGIPISVGDEIIGAISIFDLKIEFSYDEAILDMMVVIANYAAVVINNVQLFEEVSRRKNVLQAVYESSKAVSSKLSLDEILKQIVMQVRYITNTDEEKDLLIHVGLLKNKKLTYKVYLPSPQNDIENKIRVVDIENDVKIGIMGTAVITGKSQLVDNVDLVEDYIETYKETKSELAVPIKLEDEVIGIINVELPKINAFTEEDKECLENLASHAAIAIKKAEQYEELNSTKLEAERNLKEKEDFFKAAEHEMLAPIDPILNIFSFYKRKFESLKINDPQLIHFAEDGIMHCEHLSYTFENIDFIRTGDIDLNLSDTILFKEIIIPIANTLKSYALSRGVDIKYLGYQNIHESMNLDKNKMQNVFFNLLLNAIRYSHKGFTVYIKGIKTIGNKSFINIENEGIGIPDGWENRVFELYERADNAVKYVGNGTGIGLYVVKKIIQAHNCNIFVSKNTNPTIFTIELLKT